MNCFISTLWTGPFQAAEMSGWFLLIASLIETPVFNANSVGSEASDLSLHCLLMSLFGAL